MQSYPHFYTLHITQQLTRGLCGGTTFANDFIIISFILELKLPAALYIFAQIKRDNMNKQSDNGDRSNQYAQVCDEGIFQICMN